MLACRLLYLPTCVPIAMMVFVYACKQIHKWIKKKHMHKLYIKIKISNKEYIEITEKSQEARRDCWSDNVNHKSLF